MNYSIALLSKLLNCVLDYIKTLLVRAVYPLTDTVWYHYQGGSLHYDDQMEDQVQEDGGDGSDEEGRELLNQLRVDLSSFVEIINCLQSTQRKISWAKV